MSAKAVGVKSESEVTVTVTNPDDLVHEVEIGSPVHRWAGADEARRVLLKAADAALGGRGLDPMTAEALAELRKKLAGEIQGWQFGTAVAEPVKG